MCFNNFIAGNGPAGCFFILCFCLSSFWFCSNCMWCFRHINIFTRYDKIVLWSMLLCFYFLIFFSALVIAFESVCVCQSCCVAPKRFIVSCRFTGISLLLFDIFVVLLSVVLESTFVPCQTINNLTRAKMRREEWNRERKIPKQHCVDKKTKSHCAHCTGRGVSHILYIYRTVLYSHQVIRVIHTVQ